VGTRSKVRGQRAELWEAYCEDCSWGWSGRFEEGQHAITVHELNNLGHVTRLCSEWKTFGGEQLKLRGF
jgi:hypothetical protein